MASPDAITNGAIHLMQVLEGMGDNYSAAEIDAAVDNVLTHHERRLLLGLRGEVDALRIDTDRSGAIGFVNGWDTALANVMSILDEEIDG